MGRGRSRGPYGGRRQGLTGNQLKILGIVAILIDNIGAVVIQGGILHGTDRHHTDKGNCGQQNDN